MPNWFYWLANKVPLWAPLFIADHNAMRMIILWSRYRVQWHAGHILRNRQPKHPCVDTFLGCSPTSHCVIGGIMWAHRSFWNVVLADGRVGLRSGIHFKNWNSPCLLGGPEALQSGIGIFFACVRSFRVRQKREIPNLIVSSDFRSDTHLYIGKFNRE